MRLQREGTQGSPPPAPPVNVGLGRARDGLDALRAALRAEVHGARLGPERRRAVSSSAEQQQPSSQTAQPEHMRAEMLLPLAEASVFFPLALRSLYPNALSVVDKNSTFSCRKDQA